MKKIYTAFLIVSLVFVGVIPWPHEAQAALKDSLVAVWEMEENNADRVDEHNTNCSGGSGCDLTHENTVPSTTGVIDSAADLDESNQEHFTMTDANTDGDLDLVQGEFTILMWVNHRSTPSDRFEYMTKNDGGATEGWIFRLNRNAPNEELFFRIRAANCTTEETETVTWNPNTATWYHIGVTYSDADNEVKFYVDGAQQGATQTNSQSNACENTTDFYLGARPSAGVDTDWFDGFIDQSAVWDRVLTLSEIQEIYNSGSGLAYSQWDAAAADGVNSVIIISQVVAPVREMEV